MHDGYPEPTAIEPIVVQNQFLSPEARALVKKVLGQKTKDGDLIKAVIIDGYVGDNHISPHLSVSLITQKGMSIRTEGIHEHRYLEGVTDLLMAIMAESSDIETSFEFLYDHLPFKNVGKFVRLHFTGTATVACMENLEDWLMELGNDILECPEAIAHRAQVCTFCLPYAESAHQRMEFLLEARKEWTEFSATHWQLLGSFFLERLEVLPPDLSSYPEPFS